MQIKPCAVFPVPKKMKSALVYFSSSMQGGSGAIFQSFFLQRKHLEFAVSFKKVFHHLISNQSPRPGLVFNMSTREKTKMKIITKIKDQKPKLSMRMLDV